MPTDFIICSAGLFVGSCAQICAKNVPCLPSALIIQLPWDHRVHQRGGGRSGLRQALTLSNPPVGQSNPKNDKCPQISLFSARGDRAPPGLSFVHTFLESFADEWAVTVIGPFVNLITGTSYFYGRCRSMRYSVTLSPFTYVASFDFYLVVPFPFCFLGSCNLAELAELSIPSQQNLLY